MAKAAEAQVEWEKTSFRQRRKVLRTLLRYATELNKAVFKWGNGEANNCPLYTRHILDNQDAIATAACLDTGKTKVDASFGEILVTAEKLKWTITHGEKALKAERRPTNFLMMYKVNEVRWEAMGVVAACVSWK